MASTSTKWRNAVLSLGYRHAVKPLLFSQDPEHVHDKATALGISLSKNNLTRASTNLLFSFHDKRLEQTIHKIHFPNPIGLAAGFDKNALLMDIIPEMGFGFEEVGSVTGERCPGNPLPRLWRLKNSQSLVVYYGLMNDGCETIVKRFQNKTFKIPIGISVAKTNSPKKVSVDSGIKDYLKAYTTLKDYGSYHTINISCPNAYGGLPFTDPKRLALLLKEINKVRSEKPIFLKLSPDLSYKEIDTLLLVAKKNKINGLICSNLTKDRSNKKIKDVAPSCGGMSGKVLEQKSNDLLAYVAAQNKNMILMGCGGVFSAKDAYKKITLGASLVQMITGMIFEGPQVVSEINRGLAEILEKKGFSNISEAVGSEL